MAVFKGNVPSPEEVKAAFEIYLKDLHKEMPPLEITDEVELALNDAFASGVNFVCVRNMPGGEQ